MRHTRREENLILRISDEGISIKEMLPDELFALLGLVRKGLVNPSTQTAVECGADSCDDCPNEQFRNNPEWWLSLPVAEVEQ